MKFRWIRNQMRKKPRIYIMPTRMGGYLNGLIFLMFLLSVGYSNNLLLIFTLFLFGLNLMWLIQTHFHLHALKVGSVQIQDSFAGEKTLVHVTWSKAPDSPQHWELGFETKEKAFQVQRIGDENNLSTGQIVFPDRGRIDLKYLRVKSEMPMGLYYTWIYYPVEVSAWVYPKRLRDVPAISTRNDFEEGDFSSLKSGPHDVWNLKQYQGNESRKISWKHYAKSGELVVKDGEELTKALVSFGVPVNVENKELILSRICTQMVLCSQTDTAFELVTAQRKYGPAIHQKHLTECLRELSVC